MSESFKAALQALFLSRYAQLRRHLRLRLGSEDLAHDALQETYLRVEAMAERPAARFPSAYLFRIALNIAEDQRKTRARLLSTSEVEELYDMADEMADPARTAEARGEIGALDRALAELPRRRRAIVIASRVDEVPHQEIALRFGVSVRTVEKELRAGLEHCCERLGVEFVQRFGPGAGKTSKQHDDA
ncbi:sigma-70 family RNA polymerase sigma factor [Xylophilus rhododendri]|uniref:Sigma-70 family RNA polymerase sigma factor n=1 Tax=Xylophilus rhododendri TaxID=2697032 RepID=A0A857J1E8_9BURK|nr:RNA polymerase sigma factor [Xylophilus rhododendri]QHI97407.1 sigma-70 family RNA polymerase sigma factor [Xylophilus rhododendri]